MAKFAIFGLKKANLATLSRAATVEPWLVFKLRDNVLEAFTWTIGWKNKHRRPRLRILAIAGQFRHIVYALFKSGYKGGGGIIKLPDTLACIDIRGCQGLMRRRGAGRGCKVFPVLILMSGSLVKQWQTHSPDLVFTLYIETWCRIKSDESVSKRISDNYTLHAPRPGRGGCSRRYVSRWNRTDNFSIAGYIHRVHHSAATFWAGRSAAGLPGWPFWGQICQIWPFF